MLYRHTGEWGSVCGGASLQQNDDSEIHSQTRSRMSYAFEGILDFLYSKGGVMDSSLLMFIVVMLVLFFGGLIVYKKGA